MIYTTYTNEEVKEMMQRDCGNCRYNNDGICWYFNEQIEDAYLPNCQLKEKRQMTNYERIKSMSKEEMTLFFCKGDYGCGGCHGITNKTFCQEEQGRVRTWLESEACTYGYARPLVMFEKPCEASTEVEAST